MLRSSPSMPAALAPLDVKDMFNTIQQSSIVAAYRLTPEFN